MAAHTDGIRIQLWETDEENERELVLPARWEICDGCRGNGAHVNPAVDGHGISPSEFAEDPDFAEAYFGGVYDVRCEDCGGTGKVRVVDEEECARLGLTEELERWESQQAQVAQWDRDDAHTRRMEGGGCDY